MASVVDILLVEDNAGDQRLVMEALVGTESRLHIAADGIDAMKVLHEPSRWPRFWSPDLIILDLNLPRKSGREVLQEIKANPMLMRIPVIIFSTSTQREDVSDCYNLHANCYVVKPTDLEDFFQTVRLIVYFWGKVVQRSDDRVSSAA